MSATKGMLFNDLRLSIVVTLCCELMTQDTRVLLSVPIRVGLQLENSRRQELVLSPSAQLQRIPLPVQFMSTAVDPGSWQ